MSESGKNHKVGKNTRSLQPCEGGYSQGQDTLSNKHFVFWEDTS